MMLLQPTSRGMVTWSFPQQTANLQCVLRSFYRLSKSHHPDTNPSSPNAADLFSLLSESYTLLSDSSRRAAYDRDVLRLHTQHHSHHAAHPRGSYSSASQAGGRSPSGLSRRRTAFRGPPPSFYRSGGWGTQSDKRKKAHDESTGFNGMNASETSSSSNPSSSASTSSPHGGMGPGSDPFLHAYKSHTSDIPHFDRDGHKRTHEREDVRRSARARTRARRAWGDDDIEFEPQTSIVGHFAIVSGILAVTFLAPFLYLKVVGERKRAVKPGQQ